MESLPKYGEPSYTTSKNFRPISISSFLLKTLGELVDLKVKITKSIIKQCSNNLAFLKRKPDKSAHIRWSGQ